MEEGEDEENEEEEEEDGIYTAVSS